MFYNNIKSITAHRRTRVQRRQIFALFGLLFITQVVPAAGINLADSGVLVPLASYSSIEPLISTAVGVSATQDGTVYWAFFDVNGKRLAAGSKTVVFSERWSFILANEVADPNGDLADVSGFLLFANDTDASGTITSEDGPGLTANAFFVDQENGDAVYIPTLNINADWLSESTPADWLNNPIIALDFPLPDTFTIGAANAAVSGFFVQLPYLMDGVAGNGEDSKIYLFSTASPGISQEMFIYDGDGGSNILSGVATPNVNLNIIDPEALAGLTPQFYGDGFLLWSVPLLLNSTGGCNEFDQSACNFVFAFSILNSKAGGAAQTLIGSF